MKNYEYYQDCYKKLRDSNPNAIIGIDKNGKMDYCYNISCSDCLTPCKDMYASYFPHLSNFMRQEYKEIPKLPQWICGYLRALKDCGYLYLAKDKDDTEKGIIHAYNSIPEKTMENGTLSKILHILEITLSLNI